MVGQLQGGTVILNVSVHDPLKADAAVINNDDPGIGATLSNLYIEYPGLCGVSNNNGPKGQVTELPCVAITSM